MTLAEEFARTASPSTQSSAVYAHSPDGVAALSASNGTAPLELVTVMRSACS